MRKLHEVAKPGLMISQTWPTSRDKEGETLKAFETALSQDFFTSFHTVEVPYAGEKKQITRKFAGNGFAYDYRVARVLNEKNTISPIWTIKAVYVAATA